MLLRRSPQNPCYVGILAGEDGLRPTEPSALGFHVTKWYGDGTEICTDEGKLYLSVSTLNGAPAEGAGAGHG